MSVVDKKILLENVYGVSPEGLTISHCIHCDKTLFFGNPKPHWAHDDSMQQWHTNFLDLSTRGFYYGCRVHGEHELIDPFIQMVQKEYES